MYNIHTCQCKVKRNISTNYLKTSPETVVVVISVYFSDWKQQQNYVSDVFSKYILIMGLFVSNYIWLY